jgi:protoporphyrinogen oxidase
MKFIILGAGPAGLTFANRLLEKGCDDFLVLEGAHEAGGLCRSVKVDGSYLDIGGGHFLDVKRPKAIKFIFKFLPESEWNLFERDSQIIINNKSISHPIEANIWQLNVNEQVDYLESIANAGCNSGAPAPKQFVKWIYWKLGNRITEDYMLPYNSKMFGDELNNLGTYWINKLPSVSFKETLLSCLKKKAYGSQPGHSKFYYPKNHGYGEVWKRMADKLKDKIVYNSSVKGIDFATKSVLMSDGTSYSAEKIITTIPWVSLKHNNGVPSKINNHICKLKNNSIKVSYFDGSMDTSAHWIYYPSPNLSYHRKLIRHNFIVKGKGFWTETNNNRVSLNDDESIFSHVNEFSYPINTINKPVIMKELLQWARSCNVYGLGRWGEHEHYNSDVTVERAINLADSFY